MKAQEVIELLKTSKSKRKGIDKDTIDLIKEAAKDSLLDEDYVVGRPRQLVSLGYRIAEMNDNDYFNANELARTTFLLAEESCESGSEYENLLEYIYMSLDDKVWAENVIGKMKKLEDIDVMSLINAAGRQGNEYEGNDKKAAIETLKFTIDKVESAPELLRLTENFYALGEKKLATELVVNAIRENKLDRIDEIMSMFYGNREYQGFKEAVENALK